MAAKRPNRRLGFDYSKKLRGNGGSEGSGDSDEESGKSGVDATPSPLKRAERRAPPSRENAGAQGSGVVSPARGGAWSTAKTTTPKRRAKKPPPASPEEDEAEDSGDASPARGLLNHTADNSKRAATPTRGVKRSPPPLQGGERPEKRAAAGPDAAKPPKRKKKKKSKRPVEMDGLKKKKKSKMAVENDRLKKKRKVQIRKALTKPMSPPPQLMEGELNDNREDTPSSPDIAQEDEHQVKRSRASEEEQQVKRIAEEEHAGDTSPPHDNDMHSAQGEKQQEEEVANPEHGNDTSSPEDSHSAEEEEEPKDTTLSPPRDNHIVDEEEQRKDTSSAPEEDREQEDEETGAQLKKRGKKPAVERSWSYDDEFKILSALVKHAQSNGGALPDSSHLLANLTFDKIDANEDKLTDKIRKLKRRYHKMLREGCPSDRLSTQLFKLSQQLWGQVDEDEQVEPTSRDFSALASRDFSALSKLYPHLAKEVKAYAEAHSSGALIMAMFMTIGDEKAHDLDAKYKKLQIEALKLELGQASLTNEMLSALSSLTRVRL